MSDQVLFELGPLVQVVFCRWDGDMFSEWMPAALAALAVLGDPRNGKEFCSAHIVLDDIDPDMGQWIRSL